MRDSRPKGLLAKIDRGVDEDLFVAMFDQDRNPKPFVSRVVRQARFTFAPDRGNAGGCACAEERQLHKKDLTTETTKSTEVYLVPFLCALRALCGELFLPEDIGARELLRGLGL